MRKGLIFQLGLGPFSLLIVDRGVSKVVNLALYLRLFGFDS